VIVTFNRSRLKSTTNRLAELQTAVSTQIIGQEKLITRVLVALLADGHVLLEGVPGLAKTLLVKTVAQAIRAQFARVQFTPPTS
jgi:MoxR-like ATPase